MRRSRRNLSNSRLSDSSGEEWSPYGSVFPRTRARRGRRSASAPSARSPPPLSAAARRTRSISVASASADADDQSDCSSGEQSSKMKYSTFPNEFCGEGPFESLQTYPVLDGPFARNKESQLKAASSQRNTKAVITATNFERHSATSPEQSNSKEEDMPHLFPEVYDDNYVKKRQGVQIVGNKPASDKTEFTGASTSRNSKGWFLRSRDSINYQEDASDEEFLDDTAAEPSATEALGNLLADAPVPEDAEGEEERAVLTAPPQLAVAPSSLPGAGLGVWTRVALPERTRFGPYTGERMRRVKNPFYAWQIMRGGRVDSVVDAWDPRCSNWMRFVNCSRHVSEQNVQAYQRAGSIFYRTSRALKAHEELLVWYGESYAQELHISMAEHFDPKPRTLSYISFPCWSCERTFTNPLHLQAHFLLCKNKLWKKSESLSSLRAIMTIGPPGKTYVINQSATSDDNASPMCTNEDETHERTVIQLSSAQKGPIMTISPALSASKNHHKPRSRRNSSGSTVDLQSGIEKHGPDSYSHCNVDKSLKQSKTARKSKSLPNLRGEECNRRSLRIRYKNLDIGDTDEYETDLTENTQDVHTFEETSSLSNNSVSRSNEFRNSKCIRVETTNNEPQSTLRSYSSHEKRTTKKKRKITKSLPPILQEGNNALDPKKIAKSLQTGNPQSKEEFESSSEKKRILHSKKNIDNRVVEMKGCIQDSLKTFNSSTRKSLKDKRIASKKEEPICSSQEQQLSKKSKHKSIGKQDSDTSGVQRYNKSRKSNDSNEHLNNCEVPSDKISVRKSKSLSNLHDSPTSPFHTKNKFIESRQTKLFEEKSGTEVSQAVKIKTKRSKSVCSIQKRNKLPSKTNAPKIKREKARDVSKCSTAMLLNTSTPKISSSMKSSNIHGSKADLFHTKTYSKQVNQAGSCEEEKASLTACKGTVEEFPKRAKSLTNLSDTRNLETELPAVKCSSILSLVNDSQDSQDAPFTDHYPKELSMSGKVKSLPNVNSTLSKRSKHHAIQHSPKNTGDRRTSNRKKKRSKSLFNFNVRHSVELNALKKSKRYQKKTASALDLTTSAEFETITNIESSGDESEGVSFDETIISKVEHLKKEISHQDVSENVKVTSDPIKGDLGKTSEFNITKLASGFKDEDGINELMKAHCLFAMQQLAMTNARTNRSADSHTKSLCVICDMTFTNSSDLKKHTLAIHRDYTFPCSDCESTFLTIYSLARHRVMHTGERPYRCDACKSTFFSSRQYLIHRSKHTKQKPFPCVKCCSQFCTFKALKNHMAQHMTCNQHVGDTEDLSQKEATKGGQKVESIPLPAANSSLSHSSDQEAHLVRGEEKPHCHLSIAPSIRHLDEHHQNSINDEVYRCEVCKIAFACLEVLKTHLLTHTSEPDHHCRTSNAVFENSSNLESDVGTHLQNKTEQGNADFEQRKFIKTSPTPKEEKNHECAANITPNPPCCDPHHSEGKQGARCKMQTSDVNRVQLDQNQIKIVNEEIGCGTYNAPSLPPSNLDNCLQTEKNVQPCYSCGDTREPSCNLQTHTKDVGEQPYRCQECNMSFVSPRKRRIHTHTHSANVFPCPVCKKTFMTERSYERHERSHDDTKPYDCDICDRTFMDRISFVRHAYSHLNIEHKD